MADEEKGEVPFSENTQKILKIAKTEAKKRCHLCVGTEHLLFGMLSLSCYPRALTWCALQCGIEVKELANRMTQLLESRPIFASNPSSQSVSEEKELPMSPSLKKVLEIAQEIGRGEVVDKTLNIVHQHGLVATEFLLAAGLLEGSGVFAEILHRVTRGRVNSQTILKTIGVSEKKLAKLLPRPPPGVGSLVLSPSSSSSSSSSSSPSSSSSSSIVFDPSKGIPKKSDKKMFRGPSDSTNWIIPGSLLIGSLPRSRKDVEAIVNDAQIDVMVCLIGEIGNIDHLIHKYYPQYISNVSKKDVEIFYLPIPDWTAEVNEADFEGLVRTLVKKIRDARQRVFIHCLGGKGRTGMVVTALTAALYMVDFDQSQSHVVEATKLGRRSLSGWEKDYLDMPESEEQVAFVRSLLPMIVKHRRR